ncbi:Membrane nuclease MnuA [Mycoplasmopsis maculosa]|uniref:Membrane nuclease MnuA n=1 Tax=Mycoplasmopsis maculosa TaxID=114885 RepID=A0A449B3C7_9BACT|nr:hypothetical protein [Mycoplasmopsis maculosa]VEU75104.1 Membrane nuclease MnuA [Mycoplasmopsis maculosa]
MKARKILAFAPIIASINLLSSSCSLFIKKEESSKDDYTKNQKDVLDETKSIRIMHWNILNFGGEKHIKNSFKFYALSEIIRKSNSSIIGLTEVNFNDGDKISKLVEQINNDDNSNRFKFIIQSENEAVSKIHNNSKELIAIIYDSTKVKPVEFTNGRIGESFNQNISDVTVNKNTNEISLTDLKRNTYVRPPFGAKFEIISWNKNITTFFSHLDSPGAKNKEKNISGFLKRNNKSFEIKSVGSQELAEVLNLENVFEYYDNLSGENDNNIIFGGDTNIDSSGSYAFDYLKYKNYYDAKDSTNEKYLTSLTTDQHFKKGKSPYVNSYDKWLFNEVDIDFIDAKENPEFDYKIQIDKAFSNGLLDKEISTKKYIHDYKKSTNNKDKHPSDYRIIRIGLSDHAPIIIDVKNK